MRINKNDTTWKQYFLAMTDYEYKKQMDAVYNGYSSVRQEISGDRSLEEWCGTAYQIIIENSRKK